MIKLRNLKNITLIFIPLLTTGLMATASLPNSLMASQIVSENIASVNAQLISLNETIASFKSSGWNGNDQGLTKIINGKKVKLYLFESNQEGRYEYVIIKPNNRDEDVNIRYQNSIEYRLLTPKFINDFVIGKRTTYWFF